MERVHLHFCISLEKNTSKGLGKEAGPWFSLSFQEKQFSHLFLTSVIFLLTWHILPGEMDWLYAKIIHNWIQDLFITAQNLIFPSVHISAKWMCQIVEKQVIQSHWITADNRRKKENANILLQPFVLGGGNIDLNVYFFKKNI